MLGGEEGVASTILPASLTHSAGVFIGNCLLLQGLWDNGMGGGAGRKVGEGFCDPLGMGVRQGRKTVADVLLQIRG